ncbi:hypothetical protein HCJ70_16465 [Listeria booriae]|uniref:hypothetical protein n=1 Tax=Listeria booriae TaxID=1552123 RepID=UPI00162408D6|nr:hypothetical protein [Listeria booriae]MBC2100647.1 hypothetical protein [Listeria booriae]
MIWLIIGLIGLASIDSTHNYYLMFLSNALFVGPFIIDYCSITRITWLEGLSGWSKGIFIFFYIIGLIGAFTVIVVLYCGISKQLVLNIESRNLVFGASNFMLSGMKIPLVGSFLVEAFIVIYAFIMTSILGFSGNKYSDLGGKEDVNPA